MKRQYIAIEPIVSDERVCDSDREIYWADEVDQRIAELEAELRRCRDSVYEVAHDWWVALEKLESIGKIVDCDDIDVLVDVVRETRVPDDLLDELINGIRYYASMTSEPEDAGTEDAISESIEKAESILDKRKEPLDKKGSDT